MAYGLLDVANETRKQGMQGMQEADQREEQRQLMNRQMQEQQRQGMIQSGVSLIGTVAMMAMAFI